MRNNLKFIAKGLLFAFLFVILFVPVQALLMRKSLVEPWDMTNKTAGFYNEPQDEFPVMFFGSSHAYAGFSPLEIWHETGIKSYVFATQAQPMWATLTYLKEALKTQSPKLVVLECYRLVEEATYTDEGVTHSYMDDLPLSANKLALAKVSAPAGERVPLIVNFIKYHGRWAELTEADVEFHRRQAKDPFKGFVMLPPSEHPEEISVEPLQQATEPAPLSAKSEQALREFIELCQEKDIDLWLVKAPSNISPADDAKMLRVAEIAAEYGVPFDNYNTYDYYAQTGIDPQTTFFDQTHMDITAATRFNRAFAKTLTERYPSLPKARKDASWKDCYRTYLKQQRTCLEEHEK